MKRQIQRVTDLEKQYVLEVLDTQFRTSKGSMMTKRLEALFAEKFDSKYAISFVNGTATMHAALAARGIGPGDEVIVPAHTFIATAAAATFAGATPVLVDVEEKSYNLDPAQITIAVRSGAGVDGSDRVTIANLAQLVNVIAPILPPGLTIPISVAVACGVSIPDCT